MSGWIFSSLIAIVLAATVVLHASGHFPPAAPPTAGAEDPFADDRPPDAADAPSIRLPDSPVRPDPFVPDALPPEPDRPVAGDPTRPSPQLREALDVPPPPGTGQQAAPQIPDVKLRARIVANGRAEAILEVDGNLYRVGEREEITIATPRGIVVLEVVELNGDVVRLEMPQAGKLVLR